MTFSIESITVTFTEEAPESGWPNQPKVFVEDGVIGDLMEVMRNLYEANWKDLMDKSAWRT